MVAYALNPSDTYHEAVEKTNMRRSTKTNASSPVSIWLYTAWVVALFATLGAIFIGEVLGQTPCVLCWYQRIAMFPLAWILGVACLTNDQLIVRYALPLSLIGAAIALWHSLLYAGLVEEAFVPCQQNGPSCTDNAMLTVAGLPIPFLSVASFLAITVSLTNFHFHHRSSDPAP